MGVQSALTAVRAELVLLIKHIIRALLWCVIIVYGLLAFQIPGSRLISAVQAWILWAVTLTSLVSIFLLAKGGNPDRRIWIGIHAGVLAVGAVTFAWLPQWSGSIVAAVFVSFVFIPNTLGLTATRNASAGDPRAAALYGRLVCLFHPSRRARFQASLLRARALPSTEEQIASYRSLADKATPEQFALLNCHIAMVQDDWEGVLVQIRSSDALLPLLKGLEIRALGELKRVDEMLTTYVWAEPDFPARNRPFYRLYVQAFTGHIDGVRSLFDRQLRFVRPKNKAYWIFVASQAAGLHDDEARHTLESCADATDDETFRSAALRHLTDTGANQA
jgi:hypothetical protein